ncbi:MAG: dihydrodipicolinate synthase family protein [Microgenomates group bacterium]
MLILPTQTNTLEPFQMRGTPLVARAPRVPLTRTAFAAAHVVSDPLRERNPWDTRPAVDWDATLGFRTALWDQGLGLAEAMDTAQRGMGIDWETALELIQRTMLAAQAHPMRPRVACGAGTDHIALQDLRDADAIIAAYTTQAEAIEAAGGQLILMASRAFPAMDATEETYRCVYRHLIDGAKDPVVLHWLGSMFDPALAGYWGSHDVARASDFVLSLIAENPGKVDGIKISLLDQAHEEAFRARLPAGVRLYTGDDFNYADLIAGDGTRHSHALLGIFAAIAPAASQALEALALGDIAKYHALLAPTVPLSREIFRAPTRFYKAGIAFLSWLNGYQTHFIMPAGFQSSRDIAHYAQVFRMADAADLLQKPDLAESRMKTLLSLHGIEQSASSLNQVN